MGKSKCKILTATFNFILTSQNARNLYCGIRIIVSPYNNNNGHSHSGSVPGAKNW